MRHSFLFILVGMVMGLTAGLSGCGSTKYNSDYNLSRALQKENAKNKTLALADTAKPSLENKLPEEETDDVEEKKKKKKKQSKRFFMGHKVSRGFIKSGGSGNRQVLETFSFLPVYEEPNPYAPEKYFYDTKKRKIYRTGGQVDPEKFKILHGPYKKKIGDQVVEEGYFYVGTKHLRWERYRNNEDNVLLDKRHYEKGFLRDAVVTYYGDTKKIKEVIPYAYGEVQGMYYRFYENGQVEWSGMYEKGRKVGVWIKHYDFRNRRHYEYQYPKTGFDSPFEPFLIKEYDRHGSLVYEKGKLDKRSSAQR
ncbi:hypothetical protein FVR03_15960 [Pontibacter qinzhouensis]|uniref:Toxin-antitoxin system YwqK family antitoxin n=1 Tax=Pontibacter qinzhouensis TaxID=2603253 RepID=A0A5C8JKS1_9BACT|nr:hypothetical protein [Pontibacter qinzhouensis]TXK37187.1 hypothetical protein FVR03_15960 [Pontibacter qinzhouensis]